MRVLHLIYDDVANPWVGGGGAVRAHEIYRRLAGRVEVEVVTGRYPGARDGARDGVRYRRVGRSLPYAWSRWTYGRRASRLLARGGYDAAVLDHSLYTLVAIPRGAAVGVSVAQLAGPTSRERFGRGAGLVLAALERRMLRRTRVLSVMSEYLAGVLRAVGPAGTEIFVVAAGVDDELFRVERAEAGYVLYYGRFDVFQKGLDTLIAAARKFLADHSGVRLVLAGRGRDEGRLRAMVREAGLEGRAAVEADIDPPRRARLFAGALLLAMPSRFEGFGMVAAEAMAAGVPVVATDLDSLPEVVGAPEAGVLVPRDDPAALARAVSGLLADPDERRRLGVAARRRARRFTWDAVADAHFEFLQRIADR